MPDVLISEVGPRDGLQSVARPMATAHKCARIDALHAAGLRGIEVASFVPPRRLPQMADAAAVVRHARTLPGLTVLALAPNRRGAEAARAGAAHLHNTRGLGLANALAAHDAGVPTFDASLAGLGGCPFAPGASGNVVTEDLVFMFEAMGVTTGVDLGRLLAARAPLAAGLPGEPLYGRVAMAGLPKGFAGV